jgi:protein-L-isoaspartate(D-aspartate) O-methyltransferase
VTEQNFEQMRAAMVASQLRTTGVDDPRVIAAMGAVPRERYVPADRAALAYVDTIVPLGDGRGLPGPMVLGRLLTQAQVRAGDRALVVGAGSGYAAAVLGALVASVVALETAGIASGPLPDTVTRVDGPLADGWAAGAPYDLILFDGAVDHVPPAIIAQLADGGRLATAIVDKGVTRLAIGRKAGTGFGLIPFADAEVPILPGFAKPAGFSF